MGIFGQICPYGHMGICEKIWSSGVSPKKASKMELRDVNLRSVGPSVQKLWPTTFFAKKMPCILHCNAKKIRDTISSQVSGRAQLPGVIIYIVDQESNTAKSGGHTCTIWAYPSGWCGPHSVATSMKPFYDFLFETGKAYKQ